MLQSPYTKKKERQILLVDKDIDTSEFLVDNELEMQFTDGSLVYTITNKEGEPVYFMNGDYLEIRGVKYKFAKYAADLNGGIDQRIYYKEIYG